MSVTVKVVADSIGPNGVRLTTLEARYPRMIHSELMTHRVFSRNASSSRAIPVAKMIAEVQNDPVVPMSFTSNQKGMQGGPPLEGQELEEAKRIWLQARDKAVEAAQALAKLNLAKQYVNRVLEPFAHITVLVTSTEWNNFFNLRYHTDAMLEFGELAKLAFETIRDSQPQKLKAGEWHLPYVQSRSEDGIKASVARCARVSYLKHDGTASSATEDEVLYDRLLSRDVKHASPAEHQAMAVGDPNIKSGNFTGWIQYRKTVPNENLTSFQPPGGKK